ncbi:hypothetical protein MTO96_015790 [Rhipicephalus appendiculatus]
MITHANVRDEDDRKLAIVDVRDIQNFQPEHAKDFKSKFFYLVKWTDPDGTSDYYRARILALGGKRCPRFPDRPATAPLTPWKVEVMRDCYRRKLQRQGFPENLVPAALKQLNHFVVEKLADLERLAKRHRLYVVDSYSILDFHPRNTDDFDNRRVYSVFWVDEDNENTRAYEAHVLLLAATVRHWGTIKGDVSATIANLTKVLSEKIQDARKSTKRLAAISKTV